MTPDTKPTKCDCPEEYVLGVQYENSLGAPYPEEDEYEYDGVSEWHCKNCKRRWGAWSNKELFDNEKEKRYGGLLK